MEQNQQLGYGQDDQETTIVSPRFDAEAALAADPVVPLASNSITGAAGLNGILAASRLQHYFSWPLALILISASIGGAIGGLALGFYQRRQATTPSVAVPLSPSIAQEEQPLASSAPETEETAETTGPASAASPQPSATIEPSRDEEKIAGRRSESEAERATARTLPKSEKRENSASQTSASPQKPAPDRDEKDARVNPERQKDDRDVEPRETQARSDDSSRNDSSEATKKPSPSNVAVNPLSNEEEEVGPRRIDRIKDVLEDERPRRSWPRRGWRRRDLPREDEPRTRRIDRVRDIFEGGESPR